MKTPLLTLAAAVALALACPARAQDADRCVDDACSLQALLPAADSGTAAPSTADPTAAARLGTWGFDLAGMDRSVKPGDDFFGYVNGTWAEDHADPGGPLELRRFRGAARPVGSARAHSWSKAIGRRRRRRPTTRQGRRRSTGASWTRPRSRSSAPRRCSPQLGHPCGRDQGPQMARADGPLATAASAAASSAPAVSDDARDPDHYALYLSQSGLGLGDRDLYLDPKFAPQRERYQQYVAQMLGLAGWAERRPRARRRSSRWRRRSPRRTGPARESRDRDKTYNPMTLARARGAARPASRGQAFLDAAGRGQAPSASIVAPEHRVPEARRRSSPTPTSTR